jgi:hypothetical protein
MVDARSPPPGAATERAELWLEGNPYSPLRVVCGEFIDGGGSTGRTEAASCSRSSEPPPGGTAGDARFSELIDALHEASPEFRALWPHYVMKQSVTGPIAIRHPTVGIIKLDVTELRVSAHPLLTLAVHIPVRLVDRKKLTAFL